ncbi:BEM_HP_G0047160.mRNA.1.CDS.1 [Saccharomyces cerevisiae]|nr:BEM_HP_G0047160.mRNA.1.CDS.1 [Saccharomyces cerevisiae]CAI6957861.1 BEM_HP_G0047160.mRNA.1.CDS.1 [Saccharomyces cerevisiae]
MKNPSFDWERLKDLLGKINLQRIHEDIIKFEFDKDEKLILVTKSSIKIVKGWSPLTIESVPLQDPTIDTIWDYLLSLIFANKNLKYTS